MNKKIATFDTNAIIYSIQKKKDILEYLQDKIAGIDAEIIIPTGIYNELEKIINSNKSTKKDKANANIAIQMLDKWRIDGKVKFEKIEPPLDKWFISVAKDKRLIIITYDKRLREHLKRSGAQIITFKD